MTYTNNSARSGNAIVLAVGVMAICAAIIVSTTDSMVVAVGNARRDFDHNEVTAAVSTTLVRRERMLSQAATLGAEGFVRRFDPAYDYDLDTVGFVGSENYGVDFVGGVQVRWRIQPVKAREAGTWKQNPRADGEGAALELPNTFLFRVEAEGRLPGDAGESRAVVQGVRYSAISKEPLFRYIIFYSQEGAKGDIEFAHGPEFSAKGSVHTNGSIYLGGAAITASWDALKSGLMSSTLLGPYQDPYGGASAPTSPVLVNAYDGIFRLSKQVLYNRANSFPIAGDAPASFSTDWYASDAGPYPGETGAVTHYRTPTSGAAVLAATFSGAEVNPNRVKDGRGLATFETTDTKRKINGVAVRGVDEGLNQANDSRDRHRSASGLKWATDSLGASPNGFDKHARSSDNGGRIVRLPTVMGNRAFEAQKLQYDDVDGDPTTDNHEYARPLFLTATGETTNHPDATGPVVESPGAYLSYALGSSDLALTRAMRSSTTTSTDISAGYNAWIVTDKSGAASTAAPETMGLIIRERMQPDLNYLDEPATSSAGPDYVPYAYGKHMRVSRWPLWAIDVTAKGGTDMVAGLRGGGSVLEHVYTTNDSSGQIDSAKSAQAYADGGTVTMTAAADESFGAQDDVVSGLTTANGMARQPKFYRSNWRMFHLQRPEPDETIQGLVVTYFNDRDGGRTYLPNGWLGPFGGPAVKRFIDSDGVDETKAGTATLLAGTGIDLGDGGQYYSRRYTGFIKPRYSEAYTFWIGGDDGVRLWVDGKRLAERWLYFNKNMVTGVGTNGSNKARGEVATILLEKDHWYPIVIENYEGAGGDWLKVQWESASQTKEVLPASRCAPPKNANGGAFARTAWKSVQAKITAKTMAAASKAGLMVRPLAARAPSVPGTLVTIVREAENRTSSSAGTGAFVSSSWSQVADTNASGGQCMVASPDGGINDSANSYTGPALVYDISFPVAGTYYLWVRALGPSGSSDSIHVRFKPAAGVEATANNGTWVYKTSSGAMTTSWRWITRNDGGQPVAVTVPSAGTHQVIIRMREDGTKIDKLLLTNNSAAATTVPGGTAFSIDGAGVETGTCPEGVYQDPGTPAAASGLPVIADGTDPYLALAYSPTRGVFAEFRGAKASSDGRQPSRFFTGTSTETDNNGEQAVAINSATRSALLTPSQLSANVDSMTQVINRSDGADSNTGTSPGTKNDLAVSEGKYDNVRYGPWSRWKSRKPQIEVRRRLTTAWHFVLGSTSVPATQIFLPTGTPNDEDKTLQFYTDPLLTAQAGLNPLSLVMNTDNGANPRITNWTGTQFDATWTNDNNVGWLEWGNMTGWATGTEAYSNIVVGLADGQKSYSGNLTVTVTGSLVKKEWTFGNANTYWYRDNDKPKYDGTSTTVPYDKFKANIEALDSNNIVIHLSNSPPVPADFTVTPKADPGPNDYAPPADPTAWQNGTTTRTFSLDRTGWVMFDQNPYVSSRGTWWFGGSQPMSVLPWNTTLWKNISSPPVTGSFRPDLWNYTRGVLTDPSYFPRRSGVTSGGTDTVTDPAGTQVGSPRWTSDQPATFDATKPVWLRIDRSTSDYLTMFYAFTATAPTATDWQPVTTYSGVPATWPIDSWSTDLLIGPCLQSGSKATAATAEISDMQVEFHTAQADPEVAAAKTPDTKLNFEDWEERATTEPVDTDLYMAGQYQVFFGPYEITEDFFTWRNATGLSVASENWIYQHREFWSQSPWWNTYVSGTPSTAQSKDPSNLQPTGLTPTVRELIARTTLLNIDMARLQEYVKARSLTEAVASRIANAGPNTIPTPPAGLLADKFDGLIYTARANRYPWNPRTDGANPWNVALPNTTSNGDSNSDLMAMGTTARAAAYASAQAGLATSNQIKLHNGGATATITKHLQPYAGLIGDQAPAYKPTQFSHGVRLQNGANINWAFNGGSPLFGTGKTMIVTPNPLYVQGNFNTTKQNVTKNGISNTQAYVPVAIVGDQVNFLSTQWSDANWKTPGMTVDADKVTTTCINAGSSLARGYDSTLPLPTAADTTVIAAVITHNQPTTRESVRFGESASIISTMLYLENWGGKKFDYTGSLVVMDSRRYTASFQLDAAKTFGPSPFGYILDSWRTAVGLNSSGTTWGVGTQNKVPASYVAPDRSFTFNPDLLTPQGTPPFAPFGTSAKGVGGWIRIIR